MTTLRRSLAAFAVLISVAAISLLLTPPAFAEKRVALVIGNSAYQHSSRLPNPRNDAEDVAAALRRIGFETILGLDLDKAKMEDATIRFNRAARGADVAIFYYSGHAMQHGGVNYLMPIDAKLTDEADLRRLARVDDIVADLQQAKNLRILVLDSCRDNPLAEDLKRSIGATRSATIARGIAKMDSPLGMIVAYATQAGRTADDGKGRNSPYTTAFLKHIEAQEEIGTVFRRVSADVYAATSQAQLPELSLSVIGEFYLRGRPQSAAASPLCCQYMRVAETHGGAPCRSAPLQPSKTTSGSLLIVRSPVSRERSRKGRAEISRAEEERNKTSSWLRQFTVPPPAIPARPLSAARRTGRASARSSRRTASRNVTIARRWWWCRQGRSPWARRRARRIAARQKARSAVFRLRGSSPLGSSR